jgi:Domain of unknown function (DUF4345)
VTLKIWTDPLRDNELHAMKAIAAVLTAVPLIGGLAGVVGGPALVAGDHGIVNASTDSEFRFLSAAWFSMAPLIWTALPTAHDRPATLHIVAAGIVVGGMARLLSWHRLGRPRAMMIAGAALELVGVPTLLVWHTRIVRRIQRDGPLVDD